MFDMLADFLNRLDDLVTKNHKIIIIMLLVFIVLIHLYSIDIHIYFERYAILFIIL